MRHAFTAIVAVLLAGGLAGCWSTTARARTTTTQVVDHLPGSALLVDTRNGRIQVTASPEETEVRIEATISCVGRTQAQADERLAATRIEVGRDTTRRLVIRPVFPDGPRSGDGASFVVRLPDVDGVTLDTSNGGITVAGTSGALVVDTSNGAVKVHEHHGPATIDTSNGGVTVTEGRGPLDVATSNGGVRVSLADGQTGPVRIDTSNGAIRLAVSPDFNGRVSMSTSNGSVRVHNNAGGPIYTDLHRTGGHVVIGADGAASKLDTSNGSIELTIEG